MKRRAGKALCAVFALTLVLASCGSSDGEADQSEEQFEPISNRIVGLANVFAETLSIAQEEALCVAESLQDTLGEEGLQAFSEADRDPTPEETRSLFDSIANCGIVLGG